MPNAYELTVGKLQSSIEDDEICNILCSNSSAEANKKILNCLIARMRNKEELLGLCDQLELISGSPDMWTITNAIRAGQPNFFCNGFPTQTLLPLMQLKSPCKFLAIIEA